MTSRSEHHTHNHISSIIFRLRSRDTMESNESPNIVGDRLNVLLLTCMIAVLFIPRCMMDAISFTLQKRNVSYADQAEFSLAGIPGCFRLLWAPILDRVYFKRLGRRKSWLIPTQYATGIALLYMAMNFDEWLGSEDGAQKPRTRALGLTFAVCLFLTSIQSIAIGGWSLTMLKKRNVGHASTCDNVGYAISQFLGFVLFLVLQSKDFCNRFRSVPQDYGFVSFSNSVSIWAMVFFVSTTLILIFKKEASPAGNDDNHDHGLGLKESYTHLWQIIKTAPVGLAPFNGVADLKLIDAGVPSDTFALLMTPSLPFVVLAPIFLSRFLVGHLAMRTFTISYVIRLMFGILYTMFIFFTPFVKDEANELPAWHDWVLLFIYNGSNLVDTTMFIALGAFFSRISDPQFGGTYLTVFQSISVIGYRWPTSVCLWLVDFCTIRSCTKSGAKGQEECSVLLDGFFVQVIACSFIAVLWICWAKKKIYELEDMDVSEWIVKTESLKTESSTAEVKN